MLKSTIQNKANFYMENQGNFRDAHLVNNEAFNHELGIDYIGLRNPDTKKANAPIFKLSLVLDNGITVFGDIFVNNDGKSMSIRWPQDAFTDANGQTQYINRVNVPSAITAQVLRHAHTKVEVVDAIQQQEQTPAPVQQEQVQETPAPAPAPQQEKPAELNINAMSAQDLEELASMLARK